MCGILGAVADALPPELRRRLATHALAHRGPDASGQWARPEGRVWLGHTRLAILDLSKAGEQPMLSPCGNLALVFNGEIYNHEAIRQTLVAEGVQWSWRGHSDTETLLAAIQTWGVERALQRCVGMFAFAVWDERLQTLTLARDRFGEKPLYYGWLGSTFVFASELKAIRLIAPGRCLPNPDAINLYLRLCYIPAPLSAIEGIHKLLPGYTMVISPHSVGVTTLAPYWTVHHAFSRATEQPFVGS